MKKERRFLLAVVLAGAATSVTFSSCSKKDAVSAEATQAAVRVTNGRVIFANQQAFDATTNELWQKSPEQLNTWEQKLGFASLRTKYLADANQGPAASLMNKFQFPSSYATIINEAGEYQIADKIYWFHEGYKHEANSEAELQQLKSNPAASKVKFHADSKPGKPIAVQVKKPGAGANGDMQTNSNTLNSGSGEDTRYNYTFFYKDPNQYTRGNYRITYSTSVYTEDRGPGHFYTVLSLPMRVEFEAAGGGWYNAGESRRYEYSLQLYANANYKGYDSRVDVRNTLNVITPFQDSNISVELGHADVYYPANCFFCNPTTEKIYWNYDLSGSLNTALTRPNGSFVTYPVSATAPNLLW
jgi:hypothetical protein